MRKQFFLFQNKTWFFPSYHNRERVNDRRRSSVFYTSFLFPWSANQRPVEGGNGIGVQRVQRGNNANAVHGEEDRVWHWSVLEVVEFLLTHSLCMKVKVKLSYHSLCVKVKLCYRSFCVTFLFRMDPELTRYRPTPMFGIMIIWKWQKSWWNIFWKVDLNLCPVYWK